MNVGGVVLAAGASLRLGHPKQLVELQGQPLVRRAASALLASRCAQVAVVVGSEADRITPTLTGLGVEVLPCDGWSEGLAASLRCAAAWAERRGWAGLLVALSDQPALSPEHADRLIAAFAQGAARVGSRYEGVVAPPAVFGPGEWPALARLQGDRGAAPLLRQPDTVVIDWPDGALDLDTPDDWERIRQRWP